MYGKIKEHLQNELHQIKEDGLYKEERIITSPQDAVIKISTGEEVINFCANNYLGLSSHPDVIQAAKDTMDTHGFGMSSVRFICGTQDIHKELEENIADFYHTEDTILYAAAFDANGGVFEPADNARFKIIVTDGVFSMDGLVAPLDKICDLADRYDALVMIDECHATGFIGKTGRGTLEEKNVMGRIDIITGTLGKALGGAMGGYTTGKKEIIEILRQRSRPYLFSNSLAPAIVGASNKVFEMLKTDTSLRDTLEKNTKYFKKGMKEAGFDIIDGDSAIVPIMLYDAKLAQEMANMLLEKGIYVIGFFYPVVPKDKARIRVQLSASHKIEHLDTAITAFIEIGKALKIV